MEVIQGSSQYKVEMKVDGEIVHGDVLWEGFWTQSHRKYYSPWSINVFNDKGKRVFDHVFNVSNKKVRINIDSKSLGDTLAWMPQIHAFAKTHEKAEVYVSHFWDGLFDDSSYPELKFISPEETLNNCYATFNIGFFFENRTWNHPLDPRQQPLAKVAADILGVPYVEARPVLKRATDSNRREKKSVAIATASTAACKLWNHPTGWQEIVNHLTKRGYIVDIVQKEPTELIGVNDLTGDYPISDRIQQIDNADFFIGLGSGLSWLAWALKKPVVLISGFSQEWAEFNNNCYRVINKQVCHGCWNDESTVFDRNDWNWCPRFRGTDRQHECSKQISPEKVIEQIDLLV